MFHSHRFRALLYLNYTLSSPISKCHHLLQKPHPSLISLNFFSTTSDSFTISYLTNNCNLSPQEALRASKRVRFNTPKKPDSVITFFKNYGFTSSQIHTIIIRVPEILSYDHIKIISPKFEFLASKGASTSDIIDAVCRSPRFLRVSLQNHIIPAFDLVRGFCPSDKIAMGCVIACPTSLSDGRMKSNVKFLLDFGVSSPCIYRLLRSRPSILCSSDLKNVVEEIKELGFHPSKLYFSVALLSKKAMTKSQWDAKVDALKSWGFSEDAILSSFRKNPHFMLRSVDKLNAVMSYWINKLGWDSSVLLETPVLFGYSLEKRIIPRASVVQYLRSKGLIKKGASLVTPFSLIDKLFLERYVTRYENETSRLLKLYQGT